MLAQHNVGGMADDQERSAHLEGIRAISKASEDSAAAVRSRSPLLSPRKSAMQCPLILVFLGISLGSAALAQDRLNVLDTSPISMPELIELDPTTGNPINSVPVTGH